jgi:hypothetical protein
MKQIEISSKSLGFDQRYGRKKNELIADTMLFDVPDNLKGDLLKDYLRCHAINGSPLNSVSCRALIALLTMADQYGHNINQMLLVATASGYRRVVYDHHLEPKQAPTQ